MILQSEMRLNINSSFLQQVIQRFKHKVNLNPCLPPGVRMLQTFCRTEVSIKAAGGQLIPKELSLLSTSNMMTSNKGPPTKEKENPPQSDVGVIDIDRFYSLQP